MPRIELDYFGIVLNVGPSGGGAVVAHELYEPNDEGTPFAYACDGVLSLILAHACAGIDVTSPGYMEGVETSFDAIANNLGDEIPPGEIPPPNDTYGPGIMTALGEDVPHEG